ncbi:hypothetical protein MNBD_GAMMA25-1061 [hydrothermal vent metagenome]|uniref:Potassium efflux system KefA protein / Small-conductance mechanosensitive channel n=1 Tax=hydrothermal vent metagenome TaxID=652676 RepID=A0A3B1AIB0_9ZZZZ
MFKIYSPILSAVAFTLIYLISTMPAVYAAEQAESTRVKNQAPSTPPSETNNKADISEVELLIKIEAALKFDRKNLANIKKSLAGRTKISKKLQDSLKNSTTRLNELKTLHTDAQKKGDEKQVNKLELEIKELENDYNLIKEQSQLTFKAEKTVKKQIEVLEASIIQQQEALDELKGIKKPVKADTKKAPALSPMPKPVQADRQLPTSPLKLLIPTIPSAAPSTQPVDESTKNQLLQSAEQLEAHKVAKQRTQEALRAEQIALDYIEQKSAITEQIKLNKTLLKTDLDSLDNYHKILNLLNSNLKNKSMPNSDIQKIKKNIAIVKREIKNLETSLKNKELNISKAQEHSQQLKIDQKQLSKEAQNKREEAEAAHKHVIWLQSPLHPRNLLSWAYTRGPRVLLVLIFMALLLLINKYTSIKISHLMARKSSRKGSVGLNRANTLALSFRGASRVVIIFGGTLIALQEAGVDIKTVLGGAAILGVAIAFGAQNLMRDYFNGFMILLEDQYELNDIVTINNITGTVERVSMRTTMLRDLNGRAHFIPNGVITHVTNTTYEWARAVFNIPVAYKENVDHVMEVIINLANELREDEKFSSSILEAPIMLGVNSFDESSVSIKFMLQTESDQMWPVRREMLRRIKNKFDQLGIEIPVPQRAITQRTEVSL